MSGEEKERSINKPLLTVGDVAAKPKAKRSLVSRSGKQFESVDHYIAENIVQNYYPKKNQEDLELIDKAGDSNISPISPIEEGSAEKKKSCFYFFILTSIFFIIMKFIIYLKNSNLIRNLDSKNLRTPKPRVFKRQYIRFDVMRAGGWCLCSSKSVVL
jgi:ATP-dependent Zn protease